MIKDLKKIVKLLPYSANLKGNVFAFVLIFVFGLLIEIATKSSNPVGLIFFSMAGLFPAQMLMSLSVSGMVATSDLQRKMQTVYPSEIFGVSTTICWTIGCVIRYFNYKDPNGVQEVIIINGMICCAIIIVILAIYMSVAYKIYWAAFVFFIVTYVGFYVSFTSETVMQIDAPVSFGTAVIIGYVTIIGATFLHHLITKLCYKIPLHKMAQNTMLRREMK